MSNLAENLLPSRLSSYMQPFRRYAHGRIYSSGDGGTKIESGITFSAADFSTADGTTVDGPVRVTLPDGPGVLIVRTDAAAGTARVYIDDDGTGLTGNPKQLTGAGATDSLPPDGRFDWNADDGLNLLSLELDSAHDGTYVDFEFWGSEPEV